MPALPRLATRGWWGMPRTATCTPNTAISAKKSTTMARSGPQTTYGEVITKEFKAVSYLPSASATLITGPVPAAHGNVVNYDPSTTNRKLNGLGPFGRIDISGVQPIWTWGQLTAARDAANAGFTARNLLLKNEVA